MAPTKRRYRTIYIVTAALMVAMIGGYALAATSTTTGPNQASNITTSPTSGFAVATVSSEELIVITGGMAGVATAGTSNGGVGLGGTPTTLATCAANPCAAQNFRPINPATETVGDFGEQIVLSVTQPTTASGTASGFDFSITVAITIGGVPSNVVFQGFLGTGSTGAAASVTVPAYLYADLGTQAATLVIVSLSAVFNSCSTTSCP